MENSPLPKRPAHRPKLSAGLAKEKRLHLRLSPADEAALENIKKRTGESQSAILRRMIYAEDARIKI